MTKINHTSQLKFSMGTISIIGSKLQFYLQIYNLVTLMINFQSMDFLFSSLFAILKTTIKSKFLARTPLIIHLFQFLAKSKIYNHILQLLKYIDKLEMQNPLININQYFDINLSLSPEFSPQKSSDVEQKIELLPLQQVLDFSIDPSIFCDNSSKNINLDTLFQSDVQIQNNNQVVSTPKLSYYCKENQQVSGQVVQMKFQSLQLMQQQQSRSDSTSLSKQHQQKQDIKSFNKVYTFFNNMPKFLIGAIKSLHNQIKQETSIARIKQQNQQKLKQCYCQLINVLENISTKTGRRIDLLMLFNDLNEKMNTQISKKKNKNIAQKIYINLISNYQQHIINGAKQNLRQAVSSCLNKQWIHHHVQNRLFHVMEEEKKQIFQQYLNHFKRQLKEGAISYLVKKEQVVNISLHKNEK